jgi:hypothetical protein
MTRPVPLSNGGMCFFNAGPGGVQFRIVGHPEFNGDYLIRSGNENDKGPHLSNCSLTDHKDSRGFKIYYHSGSFYRQTRREQTLLYQALLYVKSHGGHEIKLGNPADTVLEELTGEDHRKIYAIWSREIEETKLRNERRRQQEEEEAERRYEERQEAREREAAKTIARENPPIAINTPSSGSLLEVRTFIKQALRRGKSYDEAIEEAYGKFPHSLVNKVAGQQ